MFRFFKSYCQKTQIRIKIRAIRVKKFLSLTSKIERKISEQKIRLALFLCSFEFFARLRRKRPEKMHGARFGRKREIKGNRPAA